MKIHQPNDINIAFPLFRSSPILSGRMFIMVSLTCALSLFFFFLRENASFCLSSCASFTLLVFVVQCVVSYLHVNLFMLLSCFRRFIYGTIIVFSKFVFAGFRLNLVLYSLICWFDLFTNVLQLLRCVYCFIFFVNIGFTRSIYRTSINHGLFD